MRKLTQNRKKEKNRCEKGKDVSGTMFLRESKDDETEKRAFWEMNFGGT